MATEAAQQVQDDTVDAAGVSLSTATRTATHPRYGSVYNPATFAAAPPVWFHRLTDGRYLALFKNRWHTATATASLTSGPLLFSAHSENTQPAQLIIDPTTGTIEGPYNWVGLDTLTAAVSRADYLFTLGTRDGKARVQHWAISRFGGLQLQGDEEVPLGYKLGLWLEGPHLRVFGADTNGKLASVRKNWGRIGVNAVVAPIMAYTTDSFPTDTADLTYRSGVAVDPLDGWEYEGVKGWYTQDYIEDHAPLVGDLPAAGPVTVTKKGDRYYIMVTENVAGAYAARVYTARAVDKDWKSWGSDVIPLGDTTTYLGGTAYLQPQLVSTSPGVVWVRSVKVISGSDQGILTTWGTLSV